MWTKSTTMTAVTSRTAKCVPVTPTADKALSAVTRDIPVVELATCALPVMSSGRERGLPGAPLRHDTSATDGVPEGGVEMTPSVQLAAFSGQDFESSLVKIFQCVGSIGVREVPAPVGVPVGKNEYIVILGAKAGDERGAPVREVTDFSFTFGAFGEELSQFSSGTLKNMALPYG